MRLFDDCTLEDLLQILSDVQEYEELPVRHNEDQMNAYDIFFPLNLSLLTHFKIE